MNTTLYQYARCISANATKKNTLCVCITTSTCLKAAYENFFRSLGFEHTSVLSFNLEASFDNLLTTLLGQQIIVAETKDASSSGGG
mmetsp:Transcript_7789/g.8586  ORF Transcript_7789/g.8586 Transcript_7789/m.8586 type:complete len:86 (+) Transcript_7789:365-622(+)